MQKYKIPAEVQIEDRIFGPITMRRLIILVLGGGITYIIWMQLQSFGMHIWLPPVFILGSFTLALAFVEPFGMRFAKFILRMVEFFFLPRLRMWDKRFSQVARWKFYESMHKKWQIKQKGKPIENDVLREKREQKEKVYQLENILDMDLDEVRNPAKK